MTAAPALTAQVPRSRVALSTLQLEGSCREDFTRALATRLIVVTDFPFVNDAA